MRPLGEGRTESLGPPNQLMFEEPWLHRRKGHPTVTDVNVRVGSSLKDKGQPEHGAHRGSWPQRARGRLGCVWWSQRWVLQAPFLGPSHPLQRPWVPMSWQASDRWLMDRESSLGAANTPTWETGPSKMMLKVPTYLKHCLVFASLLWKDHLYLLSSRTS